jgi:hypothetical protein
MSGRRLITRLTAAIGLLMAMLGILLPTPAMALTASGLSIVGVDPSTCVANFQYTRTPTIDDGGGNDFFRVVVTDSTGQVDGTANFHATIGSGTLTLVRQVPLSQPAKNSTSLTATIYEQTALFNTEPNGALLTQSPAFSVSSIICGGNGSSGSSTSPSITYYPPENRTLAYVRVDTPVYVGPDVKSQTIGTLKAGQSWFVSVRDSSGKFWQVFLGGPSLGWIKAADISVPNQSVTGASNTATSTPTAGGSTAAGANNQPGIQTVPKGTVVGVIITSHLKLHATGSISSPSVGTANAGERYILIGRLAGQTWVKVTGPAGTGWANSFYMILSAPLSQVPVITS